jgi:hypothetical protein
MKESCILISCIGNRNLLLNGAVISIDNFRNLTEEIWHKLSSSDTEQKKLLHMQILPDAISVLEDTFSIDSIYLICSNQKDETVNHKDTIWEGRIMQFLLEQDGYKVKLIEMENNPADVVEVYSVARRKCRDIVRAYPGKSFAFCNAGGAPAQKLGFAMSLELMLPEEKMHIIEVGKVEGKKASASWGSLAHFRDHAAMYQAEILIKKGMYDAAQTILQAENRTHQNFLVLAGWCQSLIDFRMDAASIEIETSLAGKEIFKIWPFAMQFRQGTLFPVMKADVRKVLVSDKPDGSRFFLQELQLLNAICDFYYFQKDAIPFFTWYYRFQETLIRHLVEHFYPSTNALSGNNIKQIRNAVVGEAKQSVNFLNSTKPESIQDGIPTRLLLLREKDCGPFRNILQVFEDCNQQFRKGSRKNSGFDILRNQISHNGIGFGWQEIYEVLPEADLEKHLNEISSAVNVSRGVGNLFENLNAVLIGHFLK